MMDFLGDRDLADKDEEAWFESISPQGEEYVGRVVIGLYGNACPRTAMNFHYLCTGELGIGLHGDKLWYKDTEFHFARKGFCLQGGDLYGWRGRGSESIYGRYFDDENFIIPHDKFSISMVNRGPNTNGSQFIITTRDCPELDGYHCVFGKVLEGHDIIMEMDSNGTDTGEPKAVKYRIGDCGVFKEEDAPKVTVGGKAFLPKWLFPSKILQIHPSTDYVIDEEDEEEGSEEREEVESEEFYTFPMKLLQGHHGFFRILFEPFPDVTKDEDALCNRNDFTETLKLARKMNPSYYEQVEHIYELRNQKLQEEEDRVEAGKRKALLESLQAEGVDTFDLTEDEIEKLYDEFKKEMYEDLYESSERFLDAQQADRELDMISKILTRRAEDAELRSRGIDPENPLGDGPIDDLSFFEELYDEE